MRVHVLQHAPFEGLGSIHDWLEQQGADISYTRFYESPELPDPAGLDFVIAMGGPMSVNDESELPWLRPEKQFVRNAIERGLAVLGICLGAQLIASALGARVYRNPVKEIGWFPIEATADGLAQGLPAACRVFHWHGETFELPAGARRLARSAACENQGFQVKSAVLGLQFHLEMTLEGVLEIVEQCGEELVPGPYVQSSDEIVGEAPATYQGTNAMLEQLLSRWLASVPGASARML
jgi:GMP synthase-like glutamine amidotransferase